MGLRTTRKEGQSMIVETGLGDIEIISSRVGSGALSVVIDAPDFMNIYRAEMGPPEHQTKPVIGCGRCGRDHESIKVKELKLKFSLETHWGVCPATNEPVLL
jgi:sRNA-binding carbon storage regulator CsrA